MVWLDRLDGQLLQLQSIYIDTDDIESYYLSQGFMKDG